jgi:hypothetical protein
MDTIINAPGRRSRAVVMLAPSLLAVLLLAASASAVQRAAESVNGGGQAATSATYKLHDSIGQGAIGPLGQGASLRIYDGFWLGLPGINVPVEGIVLATLADDGRAVIRWTVGSLSEIVGFNVYRATDELGEYARLNEQPLPVQSPGSYEDASVWPATTFWYEVRALHADSTEEAIAGSPTSLTTPGTLVLKLYPPRPNPGSGVRTIQFDVPDHIGPVRLAFYNLRGQRVRVLLDGPAERGRQERVWDGTDDSGATVATGIYFARLTVDGRTDEQKVLVLR